MTATMTFDLVLALLCAAVVVQSMRLSRHLNALRGAGMADMIARLDQATREARGVLGQLQLLVAGDLAQGVAQVARVAEARDELALLIELADARADRLVNTPATDGAICA